jgi:hypothetical protein
MGLNFKNYKQLVSAGFDVVERESGTSTGKTNIKKKATVILEEYYLCQPVAVKHNENQLYLYNRTIEKHGIKMKLCSKKTISPNIPYLKKMRNTIQII